MTTPSFPFYTRQEIFNKVCNHAMAQGERATLDDSSNACGYRTPTGLKCFIGALIPDSLYESEMDYPPEGQSTTVHGLFARFPDAMRQARLSPDDADFISSLQVIHDSKAPCDWEDYLRRYARTYDLIPPLSIKDLNDGGIHRLT